MLCSSKSLGYNGSFYTCEPGYGRQLNRRCSLFFGGDDDDDNWITSSGIGSSSTVLDTELPLENICCFAQSPFVLLKATMMFLFSLLFTESQKSMGPPELSSAADLPPELSSAANPPPEFFPATGPRIRLQLETLLAEMGRLAHENSVYARENRFLREIVEYHQLTIQDVIYMDEGAEEVTEVCPIPPLSTLPTAPSRCSSPELASVVVPEDCPIVPMPSLPSPRPSNG